MPLFQPPVVYDVPQVLEPVPPFPHGAPRLRFFGHMRPAPRGRTVILLTGGGCALVDWPGQVVPTIPEEGDVFTEAGLAGYTYDEIDRVFLGGHIYTITDEEADRLVECGYGDGITDESWEGASHFAWEGLNTWETPY